MDDLPDDDSASGVAKRRFRNLRKRLYSLLPEECLLKPQKVLNPTMVVLIDLKTLRQKLIEREDVCALCEEIQCSFNKVEDRMGRIANLELIEKEINRK